jgi:hypothetical protein
MNNWNIRANTIMRFNYETGEKFNTVPQVINSGGKLPAGWKDSTGRVVKRESRGPKLKPSTWNMMITERREWKEGEEERIIQLNAEGMTWAAIGELYGINRKTLGHRIKRYKKLKNS